MTKASPSAISSRNASMTAAVQAGNAPICSGSTTCCATTSPLAFISAQDASCDSRTMVEKPVRNSEFCISCTMPERLAFTTSRSTASMCVMRATLRRAGHQRVHARLRRALGARLRAVPTIFAPARLAWWARRSTAERQTNSHQAPLPTLQVRRSSCVLRHDQVLPFVHACNLVRADHRGAIELVDHRLSGERQAHIEPFALIDRAVNVGAVEAHAPRLPQCIRQRGPCRLE